MKYNTFGTANITYGYYDNLASTLMLVDNAGPGNAGYNPRGDVNVLDKSVRGNLVGSAGFGYVFSLTYHGQN